MRKFVILITLLLFVGLLFEIAGYSSKDLVDLINDPTPTVQAIAALNLNQGTNTVVEPKQFQENIAQVTTDLPENDQLIEAAPTPRLYNVVQPGRRDIVMLRTQVTIRRETQVGSQVFTVQQQDTLAPDTFGTFTGFTHTPLVPLERIPGGWDFGEITTYQPQGHTGIDYSATNIGTPLYSVGPGIVVMTDWTYDKWANGNGHGKTVIIYHGEYQGQKIWSVYAHCSEYVATPGQYVNGGELIAKSGNTGAGDGPHLHFAVRVGGHLTTNPVAPFSDDGHWDNPEKYLP